MIYKKIIVLVTITVLSVLLLMPAAAAEKKPEERIVYVLVEVPAEPDPTLLTHAQEIWISALEWCESRGNAQAVNHIDVDGTSSYYSYQFKPDTFRHFGVSYGLVETGLANSELMELMKNTGLQRSIVRKMITDPTVNLRVQFPGCIKQLGMPPAY